MIHPIVLSQTGLLNENRGGSLAELLAKMGKRMREEAAKVEKEKTQQ
jgi:Flp pilus assembly protein TadB